jgi:hypothetical protein
LLDPGGEAAQIVSDGRTLLGQMPINAAVLEKLAR